MRTKFEISRDKRQVTIWSDNEHMEDVVRYFVLKSDDRVHALFNGSSIALTMCDCLYVRGNVLYATPETFLVTIKKEWGKRLRQEKKDQLS